MSTPISRKEVREICEALAAELNIPYAWIKHHMDAKAGKVCYRCDGSGDYEGVGECFRCKGTGGTTREKVEDIIYWMRENPMRVRKYGNRRQRNRLQLQATWKEDYPRHWWALRNMNECPYKHHLMGLLDNIHDGRLKHHMPKLLEIADDLEVLERATRTPAPKKGTQVDVPISIRLVTEEPFSGMFSQGALTISFDTDEGWSGYVVTTDLVTRARIEHRENDYPHMQGVVKWSKGAHARIGDAEFYWKEKGVVEENLAGKGEEN